MMHFLIFFIFAYLMGSLSSAILVCRFMGLPDPRQQGSGNPGATNVLRIGGKKAAALVFLGDALKGLLPVLLAKLTGLHHFALGMVAFAAMLGHIFPLFFQFKGGKGVATAFGAILGLSWLLAIVLMVTWITVAYVSRYSSLAAITATVLTPIFSLIVGAAGYFFPLLAMCALLIWRHAENIEKLRLGTESKITI